MSDTERNTWVIVGNSGKKYIGTVKEDQEELLDKCENCDLIELSNAWGYIEVDVPLISQQGMNIQHITYCRPINNCEGATTILLAADFLQLFSHMTEEDQRRNKALVQQIVLSSQQARAERAGIKLVGPIALPGGAICVLLH